MIPRPIYFRFFLLKASLRDGFKKEKVEKTLEFSIGNINILVNILLIDLSILCSMCNVYGAHHYEATFELKNISKFREQIGFHIYYRVFQRVRTVHQNICVASLLSP